MKRLLAILLAASCLLMSGCGSWMQGNYVSITPYMGQTGSHEQDSEWISNKEQLLEAIRYVDLVIPEENWEQKVSDVKEFRVDTFVMGNDWEGKFDFLKDHCEVVYLPRTPEISTTQIKQELKK